MTECCIKNQGKKNLLKEKMTKKQIKNIKI